MSKASTHRAAWQLAGLLTLVSLAVVPHRPASVPLCTSAGIEKHGIVEVEGQRIYAYEVDGLGNHLSDFDDANGAWLHLHGSHNVKCPTPFKALCICTLVS